MPKAFSSLRKKKRYVFFRVRSDGPVNYTDIKNAVFSSLLDWIGESELAKADVNFIRNLWNGKSKTGVIRCSHKYVDKVKFGMSLVHQIGDQKVVFQTLRVSGTIKAGKAKSKL